MTPGKVKRRWRREPVRTSYIGRPIVLERYDAASGLKMRREAHMWGRKLVINRFCRGEGIVDSWVFAADATERLRRFLAETRQRAGRKAEQPKNQKSGPSKKSRGGNG
jgi:hypothetical protein